MNTIFLSYAYSMCMCVWERERESERETDRQRQTQRGRERDRETPREWYPGADIKASIFFPCSLGVGKPPRWLIPRWPCQLDAYLVTCSVFPFSLACFWPHELLGGAGHHKAGMCWTSRKSFLGSNLLLVWGAGSWENFQCLLVMCPQQQHPGSTTNMNASRLEQREGVFVCACARARVVCVCVSIYVHTLHVYACVCVCVCVCVSKRTTLLFFRYDLPRFFEMGPFTEPGTLWSSWAGQLAPRFHSFLSFQCWDWQYILSCLTFFIKCEFLDSNTGPHLCMTSTFLTEPSP